MAETKQVKLSKLFLEGRFVGHILTVDGQILSNQVSIVTSPHEEISNKMNATVTFTCNNDMVVDAPDIYL